MHTSFCEHHLGVVAAETISEMEVDQVVCCDPIAVRNQAKDLFVSLLLSIHDRTHGSFWKMIGGSPESLCKLIGISADVTLRLEILG